MTTPRPGRNVCDPLDLIQSLEDIRSRAVDVEAVAHAAADRDPPASDDPDTRREIRRLVSLVEVTHAGIESLIDEIDAVLARALEIGGAADDHADRADEIPPPAPCT